MLTICSELLGVNLVWVPSMRTIMRMILEGGVLAELQITQHGWSAISCLFFEWIMVDS